MKFGSSSCTGPQHRRDFLRVGTLALGGLGLSDLLAANAAQGTLPSDTSVILFWMWGGPSQLETWDMKPDAPAEYRGAFRPISTTVPGMEICEIFPQMAKQAHRYSLVRSLHHEMSAHNDGSIEILTGKTPTRPDPTSMAHSEHPDFGMITSRLRGAGPHGIPAYIGVPTIPFMTRPTYLGLTHGGFPTGNPSVPGFAPPNLSLGAGLNGVRLDDRRHLVTQLDRQRRDLDLSGSQEGLNRFQQQAFQMLTSNHVADAFNLEQEDPRLRDRYGRHLWGQSCLLARRLAERGSSVITIDAINPGQVEPGRPNFFSWDDHINIETGWDLNEAMRWRAKFMDGAISTLIDDIHTRGLDRKILLVCMGEFGRTPRMVFQNGICGRNHWPQAQSALVCGGGMRMGQVIGATNSKSEYPTERPLTPQDLMATIYRHLGIDPRQEFLNFSGRPIPLLFQGQPIRELA